MEWSKMKTIILLILLCTNLALLTLVLGESYADKKAEEQTRADAITFLRQGGIQLEESAVPRGTDLTPMKAERDRQNESALAAALLGEDVTMEERGGGVYLYSSAAGSVQFHSDGSFQASLEPSAFPLGGQTEQEHGQKIMAKLGFKAQVVEKQISGQGCVLKLRQLWQGAPVFNLQAVLHYSGQGLESITGARRLFGTPEQQQTQLLSPASALVEFSTGLSALGDVCSRVDSILPGYSASISLTEGMILTPVWYITTDTGGYQLDLVTGELSRA